MDEILDGFEGENNPLSNSFEISIDDIQNQAEVIQKIETIQGVRKIRHALSETEVLLKINNVVRILGIVVIAALALISVVIIMNTIKISVYTRRNEINIMKYVGATDWFIRWPFVIEGIFIGLIGAAIPIAVSWFLYGKAVAALNTSIPVIQNLFTFRYSFDIFSVLLPWSLAAGVLLGVVGSVSSIRKYLRV